jgi:hypothetical protein
MTGPLPDFKVVDGSRSPAFQIRIEPSIPPTAIVESSGATASEEAWIVIGRVVRASNRLGSQMMRDGSSPVETRVRPSGEKARTEIRFWCPSNSPADRWASRHQ